MVSWSATFCGVASTSALRVEEPTLNRTPLPRGHRDLPFFGPGGGGQVLEGGERGDRGQLAFCRVQVTAAFQRGGGIEEASSQAVARGIPTADRTEREEEGARRIVGLLKGIGVREALAVPGWCHWPAPPGTVPPCRAHLMTIHGSLHSVHGEKLNLAR